MGMLNADVSGMRLNDNRHQLLGDSEEISSFIFSSLNIVMVDKQTTKYSITTIERHRSAQNALYGVLLFR